jgi:hypothetical protein
MTAVTFLHEPPPRPRNAIRVCLKHRSGCWLIGQWSGEEAIGDAEYFFRGYLIEGQEHGFVGECVIEADGFNTYWANQMRKRIAAAVRSSRVH